MSTPLLRLSPCLLVLLIVGCKGEIDESKIISSHISSEELFARFQDRFPDAKTTVTEINVPMSFPSRYCYLGAQAELASGHRLWIQQQVEIKRSGDDLEGSSFDPDFRIVSGDEKRAELNEAQFERIMEGDDVEAVLADAGIDFDLGDIPDTQFGISRKPYHLEGNVYLWRRFGDEFYLTVGGRFLLMPDNKTVEWVEGVEPTIWLSDGPSDTSWSIKLTEEELTAIVGSRDHVKAVEIIRRKRSRPDTRVKPKGE
ncbi:hypothetical protein CA54_05440 [Symmachiella macrocystis]|uniref:Lipoprotein n=1 Tax=Symmachiella macrocystis TaxID=2527985 RepID=A0A5C6BI83_9PLAN|nr:hypothetical protein [Symmachiella macrocystis]TWU11735.1 hypothetical protein CA54_05440 [Symmachiella macrocystis]